MSAAIRSLTDVIVCVVKKLAAAAYRGYALARLNRRKEALDLLPTFEANRTARCWWGLDDKEGAFETLGRTMKLNRWRAATWMSPRGGATARRSAV